MPIFHHAAPLAPTTLHVCTLPNLPPSVRLVGAPTSTLQVGVAPWSQARSLAALPALATPAVYALIGSAGRVGRTADLGQRLRDHRKSPPMERIDEVVVVTSAHFTSDTVTLLEAVLDNHAREAGVLPIIGAPLHMPPLDAPQQRDLRHWLGEMPALLLAAGCRLFEPDYAPMPTRIEELQAERPPAIGSGAVRQGWEEAFPADLLRRPATTHYVVERDGLRAEAAVHDCWTVLKAGSQLTASTTTWDQPGVAQKRRDLCERGLVVLAGGLLRLLRDIAVPSLTNAARLVLGTNELASVWRAA